MKNHEIKTSLVSREGPGLKYYVINFMIFKKYLWKIFFNSMLYIIFQHGCEPVLIQRVLGNRFQSHNGKNIILPNFYVHSFKIAIFS